MQHGYHQIRIDQENYTAHRLACLYMTGSFPPLDIDHINGVRDDNRWINIRCVSRAVNHKNRALASNNTSGVTGVKWEKRRCKWIAEIKLDRKVRYLGQFDDFDEAVRVRKAAEKELGFHEHHGLARKLYDGTHKKAPG